LQKRIEAQIKSRVPAEVRLTIQQNKLAEAQCAKEKVSAQLREETESKRITVLERRALRREAAVPGV
jgi:hypothetical protein